MKQKERSFDRSFFFGLLFVCGRLNFGRIAFPEKVDYLGVDAGSTDLGPFIVDIDTEGNNFFDELDGKIAERKAEALHDLGIDPSFEFTKLY